MQLAHLNCSILFVSVNIIISCNTPISTGITEDESASFLQMLEGIISDEPVMEEIALFGHNRQEPRQNKKFIT